VQGCRSLMVASTQISRLRIQHLRICCSGALLLVTLLASARTRPHYGGTLRIEVHGDAWAPDGLARRLVLDGLTDLSDTGEAEPALAVQWSQKNHNQRWDFQLRPWVRFQDGTPLTAEIVVASFKALCAIGASPDATNPAPETQCPWNAVYAAGPMDIVFTTETPMPDLPELLAQTRFAVSKKDPSGVLKGTGPFQVSGFTNGALTLTAYADCWQGRPFLDSVQIFQHRSQRDQWLDLSVGRADIVQVPPELLRQAQQQHMNVRVSGPVDVLALTIPAQGRFQDQSMRQSAALAVDRAALYNVIFQKQGEITASLLPQKVSGYAFLFGTDRDLNRARALRGGASPTPLGIETEPGATMRLAGERLALNLHEAGFNARMAPPVKPAAMDLQLMHLEETGPRAALDEMLATFRLNVTVTGTGAQSLWQAESSALKANTVVPLLWLPRGWAVGERVRDIRLSPDGEPLLADASLEGAK
jgi:peptide/nickel transport system substrate-binding protein